MSTPSWPLFDLRLRTPRLELRPLREADALALLALSDLGVHDPATMPFETAWTDLPMPERHHQGFAFFSRAIAEFSPDGWAVHFGTWLDGELVGTQGILASGFLERRTVESGSWLGIAHQGKGYGKEQRAAVLHLAFAEMGATAAETAAFWDNDASNGVTRALGYEEVGEVLVDRRGTPDRQIRYRLTAERWASRQSSADSAAITVEGFEPCRTMFGL